MRPNKLKREGAVRETQEEKNKRESYKNETKNKKKKIDSLMSYPGPIQYNTAQNIYKRFYKKYFTYRQVPGYVNRYWDCMYKRRTTHLAM